MEEDDVDADERYGREMGGESDEDDRYGQEHYGEEEEIANAVQNPGVLDKAM